MVQTSTTFDDKLKKKVFVIRGDEGYARSTDVVITASTTTNSTNYFTQPITINVLRDIGDSQVAVYDGDTLLEIFDWTSTTSTTSKSYNLGYGVPHYLKAKYLGNKQCLSSTSKTIEVEVDDPNVYPSTLTYGYYGLPRNVDKGEAITYTLSTTASSSYVDSQQIKLYIDGVYFDTATTDSSGEASFTLTDVDVGLHNFQAVFEGSNNLSTSNKSVQLGVGYDVKVSSHQDMLIKNSGTIIAFDISTKDWFGDPPNGGTTTLYWDNGSLSTEITTHTGGVETLGWFPSRPPVGESFYAVSTVNNITYTSPTLHIKYFDPTSITISVPSGQGDTCATNHSTSITAMTLGNLVDGSEGTIEGVPVKFNISGIGDVTVKTDSNGYATYQYTGTGYGVRKFTMTCGSQTEAIYIYDYIQYWWSQGKKLNQSYNLTNATLNTHYNGWSVRPTASNKKATMTLNGADEDWILEFTLVSFSGGATSLNICGYVDTGWTPNQRIKVIYQDGEMKIYADNTLLNTYSVSNLQPTISSNDDQNNINSRIGIDMVSLRRISSNDPL